MGCLIKSITLLICSGFIAADAGTYDNNSEVKQTNSKRIEVYPLSQNYWDIRYGDTLGEIALHLLLYNPVKRKSLQQDIIHLNPKAFINADPAGLLAGKRLWLPAYMKQADSQINSNAMTVESYSWGIIKRSRQ